MFSQAPCPIMTTPLSLTPVSVAQKATLHRLLQLYLYELSAFTDDDVDQQGLFAYAYLDLYWTDADRFPFFIQVGQQLVGFALVRQLAVGSYSMAEFFIMRKYRGNGFGRKAATYLFDTFQGEWQIAQIDTNYPAQSFWRKIISAYTNDNFRESTAADGQQTQHFST